jgi:hypothetical protein
MLQLGLLTKATALLEHDATQTSPEEQRVVLPPFIMPPAALPSPDGLYHCTLTSKCSWVVGGRSPNLRLIAARPKGEEDSATSD